MPNPLANKRLLLGVTGSIACYKAADLASKLRQAGALVDVVLTESAQKFVTPLTFQSVTGRKAFTDAGLWGTQGHILHVGLAEVADLLVIAPATANTLAKLAHGLADNLLTLAALAARCPVLLAPAMDGGMYTHPATQENVATLRKRGVTVIGPAEGHLASGLSGAGRMVEPQELLGHIRLALAHNGPLHGHHLLVTAGGTREPLDPVRVLANRSSGKQGFALAQAALDLGARVTLIAGVTSLPTPAGARRVDVETTEEMLQAVLETAREADALLMAAAVADFRPAHRAENKIKKHAGPPQIALEHTPDILATLAALGPEANRLRVTVGFAAESQNLLENASAKLASKKLDMIVANDISAADAGFAVETNRVTLLFRDGRREPLPLLSKAEVAERVLAEVAALLAPASNPHS